MNKITLSIEGMSCSACSNGLEKYLNKQDGVISATVNLVLASATIEYDDSINIIALEKFISKAGFKSLGIYNEKKDEVKYNKITLIIYTILTIIVLYLTTGHMFKLPSISILDIHKNPINYGVFLLIISLLFIYYGKDILVKGFKNIIHKNPNMDTLISIGVITSLLYSTFSLIMIINNHNEYIHSLYFESVVVVIYFVKLGRYIESKNKEKTKSAIKDLVTITPTKALISIDGKEKEITIDEVKKNDILICKTGMKVACDGQIISGSAHVDESFITGESSPVKKSINDNVVAGSINYDGYFEYKALRIGKDSTISEIVKLVVESSNSKAPIAKLADKVSNIFVPTIILVALITFIIYLLTGNINNAIVHFVNVLVVACPCALGLATPLATIISVGKCAKEGILIKSSEILENANKIDTIVLDKTGTLTYGTLKISKVYNYSKFTDAEILSIMASLEHNSNHPLATAFKDIKGDYKITNFKTINGIGISATAEDMTIKIGSERIIDKISNKCKKDALFLSKQGNSIMYLVIDNDIAALVGVKDCIRANAKEVIKVLKSMNKEVIMLTGDNKQSANIVAKELEIDNVVADVLPKNKNDLIKRLLKDNKKVMMIGDGINDAPSLSLATIGVSISSGTDIANSSSDIILMNNDIKSIVTILKIGHKTIVNIKQNLFWAFFYNICMIPLAIGLIPNIKLNPMICCIAMILSSLTVTLNSLRLKK